MTPPDVDVAPTTPEDALGAYAVLVAAFGGKTEADLVVALHREDAVVLSLVASIDGLVVGACAFSRVTLEAASGSRAAVCLAPIGVAPALQRCGIGAALIREGISLLRARGEKVVLVLGDPSYYGRFGFDRKAAESIKTPWDGPDQQALILNGLPPASCRAVYARAFDAFV